MDEVQLLDRYLFIGALLFAIGLIGFVSRRNMIVMFLAAEMMLQGISLSLVAWGRFHNDWGGQMLVIFILTVAACEAAIALALILMLYHRSGKLDIVFWQTVREANQPRYVDQQLPDEPLRVEHWPILPTTGVEPQHPDDELIHRSHV
jgi:NADH-quinone oxidoreductase subunit K